LTSQDYFVDTKEVLSILCR